MNVLTIFKPTGAINGMTIFAGKMSENVVKWFQQQKKMSMKNGAAKTKTVANGRFESQLFSAADKLRKNIDAAEYKHIVLGLIFLKYISDSFEVLHQKLSSGEGEHAGANPEDEDEYRAENVFWVPQVARWSYLHSRAKQPSIGKDLDAAMDAIEKANPTLKGILPKVYATPNIDKLALGGLIDLIGNIALGDEAAKSKDILGRVYEYFLGEFASAEGKKGGQFYTPRSIVELMVEMIEPHKGRVYDPACGSGGMFVMSEKFVLSHRGRLDDISVFGQESNHTTYRLCRMNLAIRGIDGSQVEWNSEGSFLKDAHPDLKADYILANPPFNQDDWGWDIVKNDPRWKYGTPPSGNANFAWMQHMIYHLSPKGVMATVLANGSLSSNQSGEGDIRKNLVDADLVDCIVSLPKQLFYNTGIPACLWFISRKRLGNGDRKRTGEILFIDASEVGHLVDQTHREFTSEDIKKIANTYHEWRQKESEYEDIKGFCKSATYVEVQKHDYVLTPGRYVGTLDQIEDSEPAGEKLERLSSAMGEKIKEEQQLNEKISKRINEARRLLDSDKNNKKWEMITLGRLITTGEYEMRNNLRQPLSGAERAKISGQYPYYGAASAIDYINDFRFEGLHLLVAEDGTITSDGKHPMLQLVSNKFWVSNHAHVIRGKDEKSTRLLAYLLANVNVNPYVTGAVQPKLSKENLLRISFPYPIDEKVREEISSILYDFDSKLELLQAEARMLKDFATTLFNEISKRGSKEK